MRSAPVALPSHALRRGRGRSRGGASATLAVLLAVGTPATAQHGAAPAPIAPRPSPAQLRGAKTGSLTIDLGTPVTFDRVRLQEYVGLGQRVSLFEVEADLDGRWTRIATGTTIGHTRIVALPVMTSSRLRVTIHDARALPMIASVSLHDTSRAGTEARDGAAAH